MRRIHHRDHAVIWVVRTLDGRAFLIWSYSGKCNWSRDLLLTAPYIEMYFIGKSYCFSLATASHTIHYRSLAFSCWLRKCAKGNREPPILWNICCSTWVLGVCWHFPSLIDLIELASSPKFVNPTSSRFLPDFTMSMLSCIDISSRSIPRILPPVEF